MFSENWLALLAFWKALKKHGCFPRQGVCQANRACALDVIVATVVLFICHYLGANTILSRSLSMIIIALEWSFLLANRVAVARWVTISFEINTMNKTGRKGSKG